MMRALVLVAAVTLGGCAATPTKSASPEQPSAIEPALLERGAQLFNAAAHDDRLQLRAMIDWPRYRVIDAALKSHNEAAAAQALATLETEPQPSDAYIDGAVTELGNRLKSAASGSAPPRAMGELHDGLRAMMQKMMRSTSPARARLATMAAEALDGERGVVFRGVGDLNLVFVRDQLVAILDARWS